MNTAAVQTLMNEARSCAMAMLDTGTYIQRELPNVHMDDALRTETERVCGELIGTKHDIISELFELDDLLGGEATEAVVISRAARLVQWIWDDVNQVHKLVTALEEASKRNSAFGLAYVLVAESGVNILQPFCRAKAAADVLLADFTPTRSAAPE